MAETLSLAEKAYMVAINMFNHSDYVCIQESMYKFDGKIWKQVPKGQDESLILSEWIKTHIKAANTNSKKEVLKMLSDLTWKEYACQMNEMNSPSEWINLLDYRYNIYSKETKEYKKEDFCLWQLPFNLPEKNDATQPVKFIQFCGEVFHNPDYDQISFNKTVKMILEWIGYCLIPGNPFQIALILVGGGQNGKGKTMEVIEGILGSANCSHLDIKEINDGSALWMTKGKLVNMCGDVASEEQLDSSIMKRVVEGATIVTNKKYAQQWEMPFSAKLMMGANDIPFSRNSGFAIQRRYIMLPMVRQFSIEERDPELGKKLIHEYPYILKEALRHLPELMERKYFDLPKCAEEMYKLYSLQNDSVKAWLDEEDKGGDMEKDYCRRKDVKNEYAEYCRQSGLKAFGPHKLYKRLQELGYSLKIRNGDHCFYGIKKPENANEIY